MAIIFEISQKPFISENEMLTYTFCSFLDLIYFPFFLTPRFDFSRTKGVSMFKEIKENTEKNQ